MFILSDTPQLHMRYVLIRVVSQSLSKYINIIILYSSNINDMSINSNYMHFSRFQLYIMISKVPLRVQSITKQSRK